MRNKSIINCSPDTGCCGRRYIAAGAACKRNALLASVVMKLRLLLLLGVDMVARNCYRLYTGRVNHLTLVETHKMSGTGVHYMNMSHFGGSGIVTGRNVSSWIYNLIYGEYPTDPSLFLLLKTTHRGLFDQRLLV